jgi:hypothetical protein
MQERAAAGQPAAAFLQRAQHPSQGVRQEIEMTLQTLKSHGVGALCAALLAACGGGGGDTPQTTTNTTPATSFALAAGYKARVASGATDNFNVTGSCTGTATISTAASVPATFEGVSGYSSAQTSTVNFTNCSPASSTSTGTTYYNLSIVPIGLAIAGGEYAVFTAAPAVLPASVKVGDTAVVATMNSYADSTKLVPIGQRIVSYAIEADTSTTVIANVITRSYDQGGALLSTEQSRYRMAESGTLTRLTIDVQFSTTSQVHLLFTPK